MCNYKRKRFSPVAGRHPLRATNALHLGGFVLPTNSATIGGQDKAADILCICRWHPRLY